MKIASLAQDRRLPVGNHGFSSYINIAAALHFLNAIPNSFITEFVSEEGITLREAITRQKLASSDGLVPIPAQPDLGIDLNAEALEKYAVRL